MESDTAPRESRVRRWMYGARFTDFATHSNEAVLGALLRGSAGNIELTQRNAWLDEIDLLRTLSIPEADREEAQLYLEFDIPRLGRRIDAALIMSGLILVLEFKVGESRFTRDALDQVWDYALDLKNFHETSHDAVIVPVLIATDAVPQSIQLEMSIQDDGVFLPVRSSRYDLQTVLDAATRDSTRSSLDVHKWENGRYLPTPTIVEAARALYSQHSVEAISRSDAGATNLAVTARQVERIIEDARSGDKKAICLITGVPGSGKTLVGLDVANRHLHADSETYSVFLSGNGPLVAVLREALARDRCERAIREGRRLSKGAARQEVAAFIQNVHHFRDEYVRDTVSPPPEHVVLFDEAQRAWTREQTTSFMQRKKGYVGFQDSEPEFLISCLDRHPDWAVVACLVGGGQEINVGEAGISAWLDAIVDRFPDWQVYVSSELIESEYRCAESLERVLALPGAHRDPNLHLATSMRSFRAESLSRFVREVLDLEQESARQTLRALSGRYPIRLTRRLDLAKSWLRDQARGSERYGIVVSSQALRLKPHAIDVRVKTDPVKWFLDGKEDVRSSYFLEDVATEFQVQGLELDWACVVWDADLRFDQTSWSHNEFKGTRWNRVKSPVRRRYLENAYRVLLTRARQGMVIVVPEGSDADEDATRPHEFYDPTYAYLKSLGIVELGR